MTHPAIHGIRLVLGGNAFGWTADRDQSLAVLDAFYEGGGRMIDTAEGYSNWVPGHVGGESETIIGEWLESRGVRDEMRIHTKVGMGGEPGCTAPERVATALDASLARLRTDHVDLYYAHRDDPQTPQDEVVDGFARLVTAGLTRSVGVSNFSAERLGSALDLADAKGVARPSILQNQYNLMERDAFEGALQHLCLARGVVHLPFYGLAIGFLTGKYRRAEDAAQSVRGERAAAYLKGKGPTVLSAMDAIAAETDATLSQIALAWLNAQPAIGAPIAGARSVEQVRELVGAANLTLTPDQLARLDQASR